MRRVRSGFLIGTSVLAFVSHAVAEPRPRKPSARHAALQLIATADEDGSGSLSAGELATAAYGGLAERIHKRFSQLDRNHDGRCTRSEVNRMNAARFARLDLNGDGEFTVAELTLVMNQELERRLARVYERLDADRNGEFSLAELAAPGLKPAPKTVATRTVDVARRGTANVH
jgi:hypothetical protein